MSKNNCISKSVLSLSLFFLILFKVNVYSMELNNINHIYNEEKSKSYFFNKDGKLIYTYEYYGEATQDKEYGYLLIKDNKEKEIELCVFNQIDDTLYEYEIFDNNLIKENIKFRNNKIYEIFKINNKYILLLRDKTDSSFYVVKRDGTVSILQLNNKFEIMHNKSCIWYKWFLATNQNI